jgi:hypothetical protein
MINCYQYEYNTLLYICKKDKGWKDGIFAFYKSDYKGKESLAWHGSEWYEHFIKCELLESGEIESFGDLNYHWRPVSEYIKDLQDKILHIKNFAQI